MNYRSFDHEDQAPNFYQMIDNINRGNPYRDPEHGCPLHPEQRSEYSIWLVTEIERAGLITVDGSND